MKTKATRPSAHPPIEEARTIPAAWYVSPESYALERDRVFSKTWQCVGRGDQVARPGDFFTCTVADEPIVVVRGSDGVVRAFHNVCRHRAGDPARGAGRCSAFSCHYHGWTYALDGRLLTAPEMEGVRNFDKRDFGLVPVRAEIWEPLVFVNLDADAAPLADTLGDMIERTRPYRLESLVFADRVEYVINCNWKLYVDNFLEGYHVPRAHPGLNRVLDYKNYVVEPHGNYVLQYGPNRDAADGQNPLVAFKKKAKARPGLAGEAALGSSYYWVFPAFMWNLSPDVAQTNLIVPLGPEKTLVIFDFFYGGESKTSAATRKKNIAYSDEIQREDIGICETVQRNLHSRVYDTGRFSAKRENGVYHFHCLLRDRLK